MGIFEQARVGLGILAEGVGDVAKLFAIVVQLLYIPLLFALMMARIIILEEDPVRSYNGVYSDYFYYYATLGGVVSLILLVPFWTVVMFAPFGPRVSAFFSLVTMVGTIIGSVFLLQWREEKFVMYILTYVVYLMFALSLVFWLRCTITGVHDFCSRVRDEVDIRNGRTPHSHLQKLKKEQAKKDLEQQQQQQQIETKQPEPKSWFRFRR